MRTNIKLLHRTAHATICVVGNFFVPTKLLYEEFATLEQTSPIAIVEGTWPTYEYFYRRAGRFRRGPRLFLRTLLDQLVIS